MSPGILISRQEMTNDDHEQSHHRHINQAQGATALCFCVFNNFLQIFSYRILN